MTHRRPEARFARLARVPRDASVVVLLALAACAVPPAPPPGPPAPAAVLTPQAPMVFPPEPAPPQPQAVPPAVVVVPPPAPPPPPPPRPQTLNLADLVGKPRADVVALLGGPDQARTEAGAEVILYQGDSCTLFVFLYEPQGGGNRRVEHAELGPRGRDTSRDAACLTGLLQRAAAG